MRIKLCIAATYFRLGDITAFGWWTSNRSHPTTIVQSISSTQYFFNDGASRLYSSLSQEEKQLQDQQQQTEHPHTKLWSTTLETSPNSYVNPSIDLAIHPPSEGGTGIVAVDDVPADTVAMCLPLGEVGMIDASSILGSYTDREDEVLNMLKEMWSKELASTKSKQNSEEGKRLAVLAGIIAHLQLTRYKDLTSWTTSAVKEGYALEQSRRLGLFLDAMPLLPQHQFTWEICS